MNKLQIEMFPCLADNYGFLLHDAASGVTATVDTPDSHEIEVQLAKRGWTLTHILNTHHHMDHAGGNMALKERFACTIVGPRADAARIPGIDVALGDGDSYDLGTHRLDVYDTPGHTRGHIVYHLPDAKAAFVGDTLFAMGCGRLFEGTPEQMWASLGKIMRWPHDTMIYCAHEYTLANGSFALSVEPKNQALVDRMRDVEAKRAAGEPTVPTNLALERATNPFLRADSGELRESIGMIDDDDVDVFAQTRALKDSF